MTTDWLPPILVKEFRQGLKSRGFSVGFLGMQGLMVFSMVQYLLALPTDHSYGDLDEANVWFWGMMALITLVVMPVQACHAVSNERKNKTLELIFISRMGPRAVVYGKWMAHAAQMLLVLSAVPPYMIFRYYFGTVDVVKDLALFFLTIGLSLTLLALAVAISAQPERFSRNLVLWPVVLALGFFLFLLFDEILFYDPGGPLLEVGDLLVLVLSFFFFSVFWLEAGSLATFPGGCRTPLLKRLASLGIVLTWIGYAVYRHESFFLLFAYVFLLPMGGESLCEPAPARPGPGGVGFPKRKGQPWFPLRPGWKPAFLFYSCLFLVMGFSIRFIDRDKEIVLINRAMYNILVAPLSLLFLIPHKNEFRIGLYMLIQCTGLVVSVALIMAGLWQYEWGTLAAFLLPVYGLAWALESPRAMPLHHFYDANAFLLLATVMYLFLPLFLLLTLRDEVGLPSPAGKRAVKEAR